MSIKFAKINNLLSLLLVFLLVIFPPSNILQASDLSLDPAGQLVPTVSALPEHPIEEVEEAVPANADIANFLMEGGISPAEDEEVSIESNDPFYSTSGSWGQPYDDLWWLKRVKADQAWSISRGTDVPVAVIDTGLDFNHPDIASNVWSNAAELNGISGFDDDGNGFVDDVHGWDYYNWDNDPRDDHGHGTAVAGVIGAAVDNTLGIAGIAPESKIIPIKVLNAQGSGYVSHVISAIRYAANLGAKVINLSLGVLKNYLSRSVQTAFQNAVAYAKAKGAVIVAAAGNENKNVANTYPAGIKDVIAVGATTPTDARAYFSNFGKLLDFAAPGVDILSLRAGGTSFGSSSVVDPNYSRASGTSFSSPIVAGVVALIKAKFPLLNLDQIYQRLRSSAVDLGAAGFDQYYGYGLVNALGALTVSTSSSIKTIGVKQNSFTPFSIPKIGASYTGPVRGRQFTPDFSGPVPAPALEHSNLPTPRFEPFFRIPALERSQTLQRAQQLPFRLRSKSKRKN